MLLSISTSGLAGTPISMTKNLGRPISAAQTDMEVTMKFAKWVYRTAGIYGLLVLAPLLFLERTVSELAPPAINHPEYYYGFAIAGVAWQVAFIVISSDPQRFRP